MFREKKKEITNLLRRVSKSQVVFSRFKELSSKKLVLFVATRWNSFYLTCKRLIEVYDKVLILCEEFGIEFNVTPEWLKDVIALLEPFYDASIKLQAEEAPLAFGLPYILNIKESLEQADYNDQDLIIFKDILLQQLNDRFKNLLDVDDDDFDPRFLLSSLLHPETRDILPEKYLVKGKEIMEKLTVSQV